MQTVVKAKAMPEFRLKVTFANGFTGEVELKNHIQKSDWPVLQPLKDPSFFRRVRVKNDSVGWPNGYDVCPDVLRFWCELGHATSQAETDAHFRSEQGLAA
jgi:hypothetical protein